MIETLIEDIEQAIKGRGGWSEVIAEEMGRAIADTANNRFSKPQEPRGYLSLSSIGTPCSRKLWYKVNKSDLSEELPAKALLKFFFGDMIEELILSLAKAAGHEVVGTQDRLNVHGIKGHRDAVIDGVTVDVKSASPMSFNKFKSGDLASNDPFGYISQLSSYVYAAKDDPLVTDKKRGAFLVVDKVSGELCLDIYDFSNQFDNKELEMESAKAMVKGDIPDRPYEPVPQSKTSPNMKLPTMCSYCDFKKTCWPNLRGFVYSSGPVYLTEVVKEPDVPEIT